MGNIQSVGINPLNVPTLFHIFARFREVPNDHPLIVTALRQMLEFEEDYTVVAQAANGDDTIRLLDKHKPDVLILDLIFPGKSPEEILAHIHTAGYNTKVLILSAHRDFLIAQKLLAAGADAYILKSEASDVVLDALATVLQGGIWLSQALVQPTGNSGPDTLHPLEVADLTEREQEVLLHLSQGIDNQEIAETLCISPRTVKFHIKNIYAKLGTSSRSKVIALAWQHRSAMMNLPNYGIEPVLWTP